MLYYCSYRALASYLLVTCDRVVFSVVASAIYGVLRLLLPVFVSNWRECTYIMQTPAITNSELTLFAPVVAFAYQLISSRTIKIMQLLRVRAELLNFYKTKRGLKVSRVEIFVT